MEKGFLLELIVIFKCQTAHSYCHWYNHDARDELIVAVMWVIESNEFVSLFTAGAKDKHKLKLSSWSLIIVRGRSHRTFNSIRYPQSVTLNSDLSKIHF